MRSKNASNFRRTPCENSQVSAPYNDRFLGVNGLKKGLTDRLDFSVLFSGFLLLAFLGGCSSTHPSTAPITSTPTGGVPGKAATPIPNVQLVHAGDLLEITFFNEVNHGPGDYKFQLGDTLQVIFSYQTPDIQTLIIRPDGKISLPVVGDVVAEGTTANELAERLSKIFGLESNKVSVIAVSANTQVQNFLNTLAKNENRSGTRATVRADGLITLPLLGSVPVEGLTVERMRETLQGDYATLFPNLNISVEVIDSPYRRIAVLGEVAKPGVFPSPNPVNLMEALALAGGLLDDANKKQILLFKRVESGYNVYSIDLLDQVNHPATFLSYYLGPEDCVFVTKSHIDNLDLFVSQYLVKLLPFSTTAAQLGYTIK